MSYIRELRLYMYWLGFLSSRGDAGELDWQAIGGTWGCASSRVAKWEPDSSAEVPFREFPRILFNIERHRPTLSRYVHKYFVDMLHHSKSLHDVVAPGGTIHYVVGNSKYFDVLLPVEEIYAAMFDSVGFTNVTIEKLRKRSSKRELFEFLVSARKPA